MNSAAEQNAQHERAERDHSRQPERLQDDVAERHRVGRRADDPDDDW